MTEYSRPGDPSHSARELLEQDVFEDETFSDIDLTGAAFSGGLVGKEFQDCTFVRLAASSVVLERCSFDGCRFESCDLSSARPHDTSFRNTVFGESKLLGVNWTLCTIAFSAAFEGCLLDYSSFAAMNVSGLRMHDCSAKEVVFHESNLSRASFDGTDLRGAQFRKTNLVSADLSKARNYLLIPAENQVRKTRYSLPAAVDLLRQLGIEVVA